MPLILVVDDHPINRQLLVEELTYRGFAVETAESGQEALERLPDMRCDLVLLDIMMPGVDGESVLRAIRQRWPPAALPVIMTTARVERSDIVRALDLGANDYVTKPIDLPVLLARVRTHLALKEASDRLQQAQRTILELTASSAAASHDVEWWSRRSATELSELLGVAVHVVFDSGGAVTDTRPVSGNVRPLDVSENAARFPISSGAFGRSLGEIVVDRPAISDQERLLIETFSKQLAAAVEMRDLRRELMSARQRLTERTRDLPDERGLLQVCTKCGRCYESSITHCPHDQWKLEGGQVLPLLIGGRYRLLRRIAVGSTARLFAASDERLRRSVVLKIIKSEYFNDPEMLARFERESSAAARVVHPNVSTIYDSGQLEDGSLFFAMEHLEGLDLAQMVRSYGPGSPRQVASLLRQIGSALVAVHKAGLIHRDVKPKNIFLVEDESGFRAKILDFGIAKPIDGDLSLTRAGTFIGTPAYMAPEQIEKEARVDTRTDLYSLAAVTYEALVGRRVAEEKEMPKVFDEILHHMPPAISALVPSAGAALDAAFARALAKKQDERPATVEEWTSEVVALLDELDVPGGWPAHFALSLVDG
jgi:DNA-binding response OmpR family regulator